MLSLNDYYFKLKPSSGSGSVTPTGTLEVTKNGLYDVVNYGKANVNVEGGVNVVKSGGTVVPNSGTVEKLYFNTNLTVDEVKSILDTLTFTDVGGGYGMYVGLQGTNNANNFLLIAKYNGNYTITYEAHESQFVFASAIDETLGTTYAGWVDGFNGVIEVNDTLSTEMDGMTIGAENDKLTNLISITEGFENKTIKTLEGNYKAVDIVVTENKTVDIETYLDNKQMPMSVTVNVGGSGVSPMKLLLDGRKQANYLFQNFSGESVDNIISYSDTENITDTTYMFNSSLVQTTPPLNTSNVQAMPYMFANTTELTTVGQLDMINVKSASGMLDWCSKLTNLTLLNIKVKLKIGSGTSWGHLLTLESLINTVKELINTGSALTLTMGTANLEKIASTYVKFTDSSVTTIPTNEKGDVVVCESTDTGAMLLSDYALLKNWTLA